MTSGNARSGMPGESPLDNLYKVATEVCTCMSGVDKVAGVGLQWAR